MDDFLFHKLNEEEKSRIREQAKKMLDSFSGKISKVQVSEDEPVIERKEFERGEKNGENCDISFKKIMFENAPHKNKDFIIAEKKSWE